MSAYYNEFDPFAAAWLRNLIAQGLIAPGDVDERSIKDVSPDDLRGYRQAHFFAGIGGWSYAARLAGWPDDRALWTGSCPCQPFSVAGQGRGADDPRHLWPDFLRLIAACRPPVVMGEQVAGKAGYGWLDGVRADLAGEDYACRGVDIPACAVDAPHIRQRLYWVALADAGGEPRQQVGRGALGYETADGRARRLGGQPDSDHGHRGDDARRCGLAHPDQGGPGRRPGQPARDITDGHPAGWEEGPGRSAGGDEGDVAHADCRGRGRDAARRHARPGDAGPADGRRNGTFWSAAEWIACHDGKARRTESRISLLAHGVPNRVGLWRGFGNAIVPQVAAEVIGAFMDAAPGMRAAA